MASGFLEQLAGDVPLCGDGGMGALVASAAPRLRCPEEANLVAPETLLAVHLSYIQAGADLITTNTFGANRARLAARFLEHEAERINSQAVKVAREAREVAGRHVWIGGSIGPAGDLGDAEDERAAIFEEQARVLEARGVDLFLLETFYDLDELAAAIAAVRRVSGLPVVAMLTFDEDATTLAGVTAADAATRLRTLGIAAMGANHGAGLDAALHALEAMGAGGPPLAAMPNLGLASMSGRRVVYPHTTPEYFAEFAAQARALGARLIGGCCGTTPVQIAAIREALDAGRAPAAPYARARTDGPAAATPAAAETRLAQALREGRFVVSVELDPPKGSNAAGLLDAARTLTSSGGCEFLDVNDSPMARARMNALMASVAIQAATGVETIPHVTPRDASVMGLVSMLLGAHAGGVRNLLAVTGDPPAVGDYPGASGVYEVDSIGLTGLVSRLNRGEDAMGKAIDAPTSFFCGVAVNPSADDLDEELRRFEQKLEAGAQFAMTQTLFDLAFLDRFLDRLGGSSPIPLLVGVFYVKSHQLALKLHNEVPGIVVPDHALARLRDAGPAAADAGRNLARELIAEAREKAAGVYLVPPFKQPEAALEVLLD